MSASEMQPALQELAPAFEKKSGHKLKIEYGSTAAVEEKVAKDAELDVVFLNKAQADKLVQKAKLVGGTAATLGKMNPDVIIVAVSPVRPKSRCWRRSPCSQRCRRSPRTSRNPRATS